MPDFTPAVITFFLRLPFNLAVPDRSTFEMRRSPDPDEPPWVFLEVRKVYVTLVQAALTPYESGLAAVVDDVQPAADAGRSAQTWLVATTYPVLFDDEDKKRADSSNAFFFSTAFERCLAAANRLIRAEQIVLGNRWSRELAKEALDRSVTYWGNDLSTGEFVGSYNYKLHERPINPLPVLNADEAEARTEHIRVTIGNRLASDAAALPHPLVTPRELARSAYAGIYAGDPFGPTLLFQVAAETYLRGVARLVLVDQGKANAQIVDLVENVPFASLLKTFLPQHLGGDWSSPTSPVSQYKTDVYQIRVDLAHRGILPDWLQMNKTILAFEGLVGHVEARVLRTWRRRPRTLLAISEPWAGGTLVPPRASLPICEQLLGELTPYWLPFDMAGRAPSFK